MRHFVTACLLFAFSLGLAAPAQAQQSRKLSIQTDDQNRPRIRVGLPAVSQTNLFKTGMWTPVYIDLVYEDRSDKPESIGAKDGDIVVEAIDSDDVQNRYIVKWPAMAPGDQTTVIAYAKPSSNNRDVTVTLRDAAGRNLHPPVTARRETSDGLPPSTILYLLAGGARLEAGKKGTQADQRNEYFAFVDKVEDLPTHWFGYAAVDVMVLGTSAKAFIDESTGLNSETHKLRRKALEEWVSRGGRLVISTGRNQQFVKTLLERMPLIKVSITRVEKQNLSQDTWPGEFQIFAPLNGVDVAVLDPVKPGQGVDVLVKTKGTDGRDQPLVVQAAYGMGRVMLVAFDLDVPPFTEWTAGKEQFWRKIQKDYPYGMEPRLAAGGNNPAAMGGVGFMGDTNEIGGQLLDSLEQFDVPVISFGWVALFILLYIIVVGPLDYLFLKKVVKRLELTWITFPAVVLVVSAAAYFTAYYLKGNDLKINKIDVVDIVAEVDPKTKEAQAVQAYGTTWFTIFSPRIQHYTIGIEPAYPEWAGQPANPENDVLLNWLGKPETYGIAGRSSTPSLFARAYEYTTNASGLKGVPVQVWATKSFGASWSASLRGAQPKPLFVSDVVELAEPGREPVLRGTITNNLPVEIKDVVLFHRGNCFVLDDLPPGVAKDVANKQGKTKLQWFQDTWQNFDSPVDPAKKPSKAASGYHAPACSLMKTLLFHRTHFESPMRNSFYRQLDQGWRLSDKHTDEIIVVGRVVPRTGSAEEIHRDKVAPSRLWLGQLPSGNQPWKAPAGTLSQETYIRVFIPIVRGP